MIHNSSIRAVFTSAAPDLQAISRAAGYSAGTSSGLFLQPAAVISLVVLAGLLFQKKPFAQIVTGTVKSFVGFAMILVGGEFITDATMPFTQMLSEGFHVRGTVPNAEASTSILLERYGMEISLVMVLSLFLNLLLARITRYHYVFLTGHQGMYMSALTVCVLRSSGVTGVLEIVCGTLAVGVIMILSPALTQPFTRRICGNDRAALGHFGGFGYLLAAALGGIFGDTDHSAEKIHLPKWLSFIRDTSVMIFLTMAAMNLIAAAAAGPSYVETALSGGRSSIVFALELAVYFTIGFTVITTGVRWMIDEIVPAVRGIAKVWVPNAKPTIDCPLVFPYAPNSLVIGFLASFLGGLFCMGMMVACGLPAILPGTVPHFFCGATAGVYGNCTGGRRGAAVGGFVNGVLISVLPFLSFSYLGDITETGVAFAEADFGLAAVLLGSWLERVGPWGVIVIFLCIIALMILLPETLEDREKGVPWYIEDSNRHVYDGDK